MPRRYTIQQIYKALATAHSRLDFKRFCHFVLSRPPRDNNAWQHEQWDRYNALMESFLRMPQEQFALIIHEGSKDAEDST